MSIFPPLPAGQRLRVSSLLHFMAAETPHPVLEKWTRSRQGDPGRLSVQLAVTPEIEREMLAPFVHRILDRRPDRLIPEAKAMVREAGDNPRLPQILMVPTGTDLDPYGSEVAKLLGVGVVVLRSGSGELGELLRHLEVNPPITIP